MLCYKLVRVSYLLSWEFLMPVSLGSPSKKAMSRAATSLELTRLLSAPQTFITTSGEGVFWLPSSGNIVTKLDTTLGANSGQIAKKGSLLKQIIKLQCFHNRIFWLVLTQTIFVPAMSGQVPEEASDGTLFKIIGCLQFIQNCRQHTLMFQGNTTQDRWPLYALKKKKEYLMQNTKF